MSLPRPTDAARIDDAPEVDPELFEDDDGEPMRDSKDRVVYRTRKHDIEEFEAAGDVSLCSDFGLDGVLHAAVRGHQHDEPDGARHPGAAHRERLDRHQGLRPHDGFVPDPDRHGAARQRHPR